MGLTRDLKKFAKTLDLDFTGFCPVDAFDDAPESGKPGQYLENARSIISIGYRLNKASIQNLPASRTAYMLEHDYANSHLDRASHRIARFLEEKGFDSIGFDSGAGFYHLAGKDPERYAGDFSHKHAAVACGLGLFGLNNLVISPEWGPMIRLASIITSAGFDYDNTLKDNPCPAQQCRRCITVCPVNALDERKGKSDPEKGRGMDTEACYDYIFNKLNGKRCGLCIKACIEELNL